MTANTATGIAAGMSIGLTCPILGAPVDALVVGLLAAVFMSIWLPGINDRLKAAAAVALAGLLSGYGAPVAATWLARTYTVIDETNALRLLLSALIGMSIPALLPALLNRARLVIGGIKEMQ